MNFFKKVRNFLIPYIEGIENNWWHRLVNVLIYGSTILILILFSIGFFVEKDNWIKTTPKIFSFEDGYSSTSGKEFECEYKNGISSAIPEISCEEISLDGINVVERYNETIRKRFNLKSFECIEQKNENGKYSEESLRCLREYINFIPVTADPVSVSADNIGVEISHMRFIRGFSVKINTEIIYLKFFEDIFLILAIVAGWFIFWQSIIYRTILYVIYGKKK